MIPGLNVEYKTIYGFLAGIPALNKVLNVNSHSSNAYRQLGSVNGRESDNDSIVYNPVMLISSQNAQQNADS